MVAIVRASSWMVAAMSDPMSSPFAHAKRNLGFSCFTGRGIKRATAEFSFHALVRNLIKAIGPGHLTPAAC